MRRGMTRSATISGGIHLLILLALILVIPHPLPPPPPADDTVEMDFVGTADSAQKSDRTGHVAAPTEADTPAKENPALVDPKPQPIETAPPPPPPPPPPPDSAPTRVTSLDSAKLAPPPDENAVEKLRRPPPMKVAASEPPKPVNAPKPPMPVQKPQDAKPMDTVRHQQNPTKTPAPDTSSLLNTMEKLMADQKQTAPPKHVYNPSRGGAHDAGGQKHGNLTGALSEGQRKTIGDSVRRCYSEDTAAKDYATYSTMMTVTIDATGEVHDVVLSPADQARANSDPAFRAFAERAEHAVQDPVCAHLPLPPNLLGQPSSQLTFRFRP